MLNICKQKMALLYNNIMIVTEKINSEFDKNRNKYLWILGIGYKLVMDFYFILVMHPMYGYYGLYCNPSIINYTISWAMCIWGYYLILQVKNQVISVFLHIQWVLTICPVIVLYGLQSERSIVYLLYVMMVLLLQVLIGKREKNTVAIGFGKENLSSYVTVFLCIFVVAVWIIMSLWNDFAGVKAFDWDYIYVMREKLVYPPLFQYIVNWSTRAIIPWLLIIGLEGKKVSLIIYSLLIQTLFYMMLGHKLPLLLMAVVLAVYIVTKIKVFFVGLYMGLMSVGGICVVSYLLESMGNENINALLNALYGMRTLFVPAMIKYQHYEMFSKYPKVFFADGVIGKLLSQTNIYVNSLGVTVHAFANGGSTASQSNTGYLADSYDQMGFIGMLLIGAFVVLVIKFMSKYIDYIPQTVLYCVVVCFAVMLNDNAFFTTILTGGIWLLILMLMIYAKGGKKNDIL